MSEVKEPGPDNPRRRRRLGVWGCLFAALSVFALLLVSATLAVVLYGKPFIEQRIIEQARERGFELRIGALDLGWTQVTLRHVDVRLIGVEGITLHVESIDVTLDQFQPIAAELEGVDTQLEGSAPALALQLAEWANQYPPDPPEGLRGTVSAERVDVAWREAPNEEPWARLNNGTIVPTKQGGAFTAKNANVVGLELGRVGASWSAEVAVVDFGFWSTENEPAPVRIEVQHASESPTATFTLNPTPLHRLSEPLGTKLPIDEDVLLSGKVNLSLPKSSLPDSIERGAMEGHLELTLKGYVPPHPVELSGFVFGDTTTITSRIAVAEDRETITLDETTLTAGKFVLGGQGKVTRYPDHAQVQMALRGSLPCSSLANAAAHTRLGRTLGSIVGPTASRLLKGSVAVLVHFEADTRDLNSAKMLRTIGVGCGLKPIEIPGVGTIDLGNVNLNDLPDLPKGFPSLPPVPSALPPLRPGGLPLPSLRQELRAAPASSSD